MNYTLSDDGTYYYCSGIGTATDTQIIIASSYYGLPVISISSRAFSGCSNLTSVSIPDSVISIDFGAFKDCSGLTSIEIPDGVTSIDRSTFNGCNSLSSITIGKGVTSIGTLAFGGCGNLTNVYYKGTAEEWNNISVSATNSYLKSVTRYYYSEAEPSESGNFWHHDTDGVTPVSWRNEN